jgi:hypothetical protein
MASIFSIPFNFNPVQTAVTTSTYTVPAGKYAFVDMQNAVKPVLNSVNMFQSSTQTMSYGIGSNALGDIAIPVSCDSIEIAMSTTSSGSIYVGIGLPGTNTTNYHYSYTYTTGVGGTMTINLKGIPADRLYIYHASAGALTITSLTEKYTRNDKIWLRSGDVLSMTSGFLVYSEYYNVG